MNKIITLNFKKMFMEIFKSETDENASYMMILRLKLRNNNKVYTFSKH